MNEELEVLKLVACNLKKIGVKYMISGSMAANYYSIPRMTRDIDVVVEMADIDIDKFAGIFEAAFYVDAEIIREEIKTNGMFNIIHKKYFIKIDFIIRKNAEFNETEFSRRKSVVIDSTPVSIVSAEDLILAKLIWAKDSHSEMQIKDVANLIRCVDGLHADYIQKWVKTLGLEKLYEEAAQ